MLLPGFIDSHVHILGGGGEGGFSTRTPEIKIEDLIDAGTYTVKKHEQLQESQKNIERNYT